MAVRTILHYPDPRLREVADPVTDFDQELSVLIEDMAETMYAAPGVGLAATQIGVKKQLFVIDLADDDEPSDLCVFINPKLTLGKGEIVYGEGCLSFPGLNEDITRAAEVTVHAVDREGKPFEYSAEGLMAVAIQHENDHLNGRLMIDHVGVLKRRIMHRKMLKRQAEVGDKRMS